MNTRSRIGFLLSMVAALAIAAVPAFAETVVTNAVNTSVTEAKTSVESLLQTNAPLILGVALLWVIIRFGRRILANFR